MNNFYVGQPVVCVDDQNYLVTPTIRPHPHKGEVLVVAAIPTEGSLQFTQTGVGTGHPAFFRTRFRPVVSRKTGMEILESLKDPKAKPHPAKEEPKRVPVDHNIIAAE